MAVDLGGITVRLIAVKERLKRPRDLLVLPLLRAALTRTSPRGSPIRPPRDKARSAAGA